MFLFEWGIIAILIVLNLIVLKNFKVQRKRIINMARQLNHLAQESECANWTSQRNKQDLVLIKEALNIRESV